MTICKIVLKMFRSTTGRQAARAQYSHLHGPFRVVVDDCLMCKEVWKMKTGIEQGLNIFRKQPPEKLEKIH
jgi:hypothetical protein